MNIERTVRPFAVALQLAFVAIAPPAVAATVRAQVVDRDGVALHDLRVSLRSIEPEGEARSAGPLVRSLKTGASGRVEFTDVASGRYRLRVSTHGTEFVAPEENPLTPPPLLTIDDPEQTVELRLELHRGTPICARFRVDGAWRPLVAMLHLREVESGRQREIRLEQDVERCEPLFDGRWQARVETPHGYLLEAVELGGRGVSGFEIELDARAGSPARFVEWRYVAPARLSGHVGISGEIGVRVRATLVTPGPWRARVDERGGSRYTPVEAGVDRLTGRYTMDLPDGAWRVEPVGEGLTSAEPESLEITLAPGEEGRADFVVRGESTGTGSLSVFVKLPEGHRPEGRVVAELWPLDESRRGEQPLRRTTSRAAYAMAYFRGVEPGDYLVAAAHPDYREGTLEIAGFDPDDRDPPSRVVTLRPAGRLDVVFEDAAPDPAGALVELERVNESRPTIVVEPGIVAAANRPRAEVDATGHGAVRGLYPGRYRIRIEVDDGIVELALGERWFDGPSVIEFTAAEQRRIRARIVPAASIEGSLHCAGGERLPTAVDVRLVAAEDRPSGRLDVAWQDAVMLAEDGMMLTGSQRDRFRVGPLRQTGALLAVRPAGYDRWTWAFGTENGAEAGSFETEPGRALDLGRIAIDCAPALRVHPRLRDDLPIPSLEHTGSRDETFRIGGQVETTDATRLRVERATVDAFPEVVFLRELPEGEATLRIQVGHPYFVPFRWIDVTVEATLERGRTVDVALPIEDVGGAIEVVDRSGSAAMVRATSAAGVEHRARVAYGRARLENLPAGTWQVDSCVDEACGSVVERWSGIDLPRLTTIELPR